MLNCSQFKIHYYEIPIYKLGEPIIIHFFGDVHRYAKGCAEDKWLQFLDEAKRAKYGYFFGMGDYDDFLSQSEREIMANPKLHDDSKWTIDDIFTRRNMDFKKEIDFMRNRIIGLIEGNHYGVYSSGGMTTTQELCNMLKCRYLGVNSLVRVSFRYKKKHISKDIFAHHGRGASRLLGSSLNTVEKMIGNADADIYIMGHDHQRGVMKTSRLYLTHGTSLSIKDKTMLVCRSGSFLRGYIPDHQSYVVKAAMRPAELGALKVILTPRLTHNSCLNLSMEVMI